MALLFSVSAVGCRSFSSLRNKSIVFDSSVNVKVRPLKSTHGPSFGRTIFDKAIDIQGPHGLQSVKVCSGLKPTISDENQYGEKKLFIMPDNPLYEALNRRRRRFVDGMWGTITSMLRHGIEGVTNGHQTSVRLSGVGYKAMMEGENLVLKLGYSHDIILPIPEGLKVKINLPTKLTIIGTSIQHVTQFAAKIRSFRKPEPYNGKGIFVGNETIRLKEGKKK